MAIEFTDPASQPAVGGVAAPSSPPHKTPSGKMVSDHFAAVRQRGVLNSTLDGISEQFRRHNPGMDCKWQFYNPKMEMGGTDRVINDEAMGFSVVDASELGTGTASAQTSGPVRRGDLILMKGPKELFDMIRDADAEQARADVDAPKAAFAENLKQTAVRLPSTGEVDQATVTGKIGVKTEEVTVDASGDNEKPK